MQDRDDPRPPDGCSALPDLIVNEDQLIELLTRPNAEVIEVVREIQGPLVVLGAGGKMGPTLCVLAKRAASAAGHTLEVIAVSRFSDPAARLWLEQQQVQTIRCDLLDEASVRSLPESQNVIYLVGLKFGTSEDPARTWAVNTLIPAYTAKRYSRARMVCLSTGNVYPLVPATSRGARETAALTPAGEYPNAAVARERLFGYFSKTAPTPMVLIRLNYAVELRYGVLVDLGLKTWNGDAIDLTMGHLNCIWQGDANDLILRSLKLASSPARALNLTSPEIFPVRHLAQRLGALLGRAPVFHGKESDTALLSDASMICRELGRPKIPVDQVMKWTADWIRHGRRLLMKPTHFATRDGTY